MSKWDFMGVMASGCTTDDWMYIEEQEIRHKKKNTLLLIDAENVSHKKADVIMGRVALLGVIDIGKVYGRQKDSHVKGWYEKARENGLEDIRLYGPPEKDKVDKKIQRDARKEISVHKNLDIVCLVTSDSGYVDMIDELRSQGKRVVVIGEEKASEALRNSCSQFIEI